MTGKKKYDKFDYKVGSKSEIIGFAAGIILVAVSFIPLLADFPRDLLCMISAVLCSYPVVIDAFYGLKKKKLAKSLLMIIIIVTLMITGGFFDAAMCAILIRLGDIAEKAAEQRECKLTGSLKKAIAPTGHLVRAEGGFEIIDASEISVGAELAVLPGEILPVDALIEEGKGAFDLSLITGDTTPVFAAPGDTVPAGAINGQSTLFYISYKDSGSSTASVLYEAVRDACDKEFPDGKHKKLAKYISRAFIAAGFALAVIGSIVTRSPFDFIVRGLGVIALCLTGPVLAGAHLISTSSLVDTAAVGVVMKSPGGIGKLVKSKIILLCEAVFSKRSPNVKAASALLKSYGAEEIDAVIPDDTKEKDELISRYGADKIISPEGGNIKEGQRLIVDDSEMTLSERFARANDFTAVFNTLNFENKADAVITGSNLLRLAEAIKKCVKSRSILRIFTLFFTVLKIAAAALAAAGVTPVWVSFAADTAILLFAFIATVSKKKQANK